MSVNTDVCEAIRRGHHRNPIFVRLESLLQVHHSGGGQVTPDSRKTKSCCTLGCLAIFSDFKMYERIST